MREGLGKELARKAFHMLSLVYWTIYKLVGFPRVMGLMWAWSTVVVAVEVSRLCLPELNKALLGSMSSIARPEELKRVSGIFHTTLGVLLLLIFFGDRPAVVSAAIFCVAFGDTAAALAGKSFGRRRFLGGKKSLEGSLACWSACFLSCLAWGFGAVPSCVAALAATGVEACPTTPYFNDNLWMPVAAAWALRALS